TVASCTTTIYRGTPGSALQGRDRRFRWCVLVLPVPPVPPLPGPVSRPLAASMSLGCGSAAVNRPGGSNGARVAHGAGPGGVEAGGQQGGLAGVLAGFLLEIGGGADEQGAAVGSAEHAGEHAGAGLDLVDDLAALAHPDGTAAEAVGYPHRPVGVQAAAVGG